MSMRALLKACESSLRTLLKDQSGKVCKRMPTGRPPQNCGQWFYAVHSGGASSLDDNPLSDDKEHRVTVTITGRYAYAPQDRVGERLTLEDELFDRAEVIAGTSGLHANYDVLNAANALIPGFGVTVNGFVEPLRFADYSPVIEMGGEWVGEEDRDEPATVLVIDVRFVGARRIVLF